jgi:hypothetical protein
MKMRSITGNGDEVRTTDADSGGEKGSKLQRYDLIPVAPLEEVAKVYGQGAEKYASRNWERGYSWSLSYASLQRHANAFWAGESIDEEQGRHHLAAVIFHAMALMEFELKELGTDDRAPLNVAVERPEAQGVLQFPEAAEADKRAYSRYSGRAERKAIFEGLEWTEEEPPREIVPIQKLWDEAGERTERAFQSAADELYPDSPISWLDRDNPEFYGEGSNDL